MALRPCFQQKSAARAREPSSCQVLPFPYDAGADVDCLLYMCTLRVCALCDGVKKKKRCAAEESSSCKVLPLPYAAGARDISQDICWHDCEVHEPPAERVAKNHVLPSQNMLRQSDLRGLEHLVRLWLSFS